MTYEKAFSVSSAANLHSRDRWFIYKTPNGDYVATPHHIPWRHGTPPKSVLIGEVRRMTPR